jgi:hypothetical protein
MKLHANAKKILESVDRGEWRSVRGAKRERTRYARHARDTFRKHRRVNIRDLAQGPGGDPEAPA